MNMHWKLTTNKDALKRESKSNIDLTANNQSRCNKSEQIIRYIKSERKINMH